MHITFSQYLSPKNRKSQNSIFFVIDWDSLWPVIEWNIECSKYFTNDPS